MVWRLTPEARANPAAAMLRLRRNVASRVWTRGSAGVVWSPLDGIVVYTIPPEGTPAGMRASPPGKAAPRDRSAVHFDDVCGGLRMGSGCYAKDRHRGGGGLEVRHGRGFVGVSARASGGGTSDFVRLIGQFLRAAS